MSIETLLNVEMPACQAIQLLKGQFNLTQGKEFMWTFLLSVNGYKDLN
jgi:hypothetical protein